MAEVLTQKQIDEMLANLQSGDVKIEEQPTGKKVKDYDFSSPKKFTKEQIKLLNSIYDNFARLFCLQISSMLRISCQMEIVDIEEQQYAEFNNALSDSVLIGVFNLIKATEASDDKQILVEVARTSSFSIIDRLLGGNGEAYDLTRDYTDIELSLLDYLFKHMANSMHNAWNNYMEVDSEFHMIETNSRLIQSILPDETVVIIVFDLTMRNVTGKINICLPADTLDQIFRQFDAKYAKPGSKRGGDEQDNERREALMDTLQDSDLVVKGMLGKTEINVQELLSLQPGDIIALQTPVHGNQISVEVEGNPWFLGQIGTHKKKYAIKVSETLE